MEIRELLQIEIWSKRITRKIFLGFAIVALALVAWFGTNMYWLTPAEREAGKAALGEIESLKAGAFSADMKDFKVREKKVLQAVDTADQAAWTYRDKRVSFLLRGYLLMIDSARLSVETDGLLKQRRIVLKDPDPELHRQTRQSGAEIEVLLSLQLHMALGS